MYHKTTIVGRLGQEPSLRYTPAGTAVCTFSVAVNTFRGGQKRTVWYKVTTWEKLAENCNQYLAKGRQVLAEGELQADERGNPKTFQRKDGSWSASFELTARNVTFLGKEPQGQKEIDEVYGEEEIPF